MDEIEQLKKRIEILELEKKIAVLEKEVAELKGKNWNWTYYSTTLTPVTSGGNIAPRQSNNI